MQEYQIHEPGSKFTGVCPNCSHSLFDVLPIEPLYDLNTVAGYTGLSLTAVRTWISRYKDKLVQPPLYRKNSQHVERRFLRARDVQTIMNATTQTRLESGRFMNMLKYLQEQENATDRDTTEATEQAHDSGERSGGSRSKSGQTCDPSWGGYNNPSR